MQNIKAAKSSANLIALNLYKQYLPQSVAKELYDPEIEKAESYDYQEKHLDALKVYMKSLQDQTEMLERYQIGVRRDESSKNTKIAELCGLKIVKPNFDELDKKSLNFKNKFRYSSGLQNNFYHTQSQNKSLVHSHYSSGFQFTPNKYLSFPSILEQKQKTLQEKNSREFLGFLRQQEKIVYNYDYLSDVEENVEQKQGKQEKKEEGGVSPMLWFVLPILLGIKGVFYLFQYLLYSELPLPYQYYLQLQNTVPSLQYTQNQQQQIQNKQQQYY